MNTTKRVGNPHVINSFRKVASEKYNNIINKNTQNNIINKNHE
jgi:hypothetical protein